jgi:hypothetical protein
VVTASCCKLLPVLPLERAAGRETCNARLPVAFLRADITWLGLIRPDVFWEHTAQ